MSCEKRFDSAAVRVTTEVRQIHMWVVICSLCAIRKESGICVFAPASRTGRGPVVWIGQVHPPTGGVLALDQVAPHDVPWMVWQRVQTALPVNEKDWIRTRENRGPVRAGLPYAEELPLSSPHPIRPTQIWFTS
uniref:Uncharacterized protein n=1 Tax=Pyricularia oryzae (strain P131) TaxID=1143193 RepID=L7J3N4_PYRO1